MNRIYTEKIIYFIMSEPKVFRQRFLYRDNPDNKSFIDQVVSLGLNNNWFDKELVEIGKNFDSIILTVVCMNDYDLEKFGEMDVDDIISKHKDDKKMRNFVYEVEFKEDEESQIVNRPCRKSFLESECEII